MRLDSASPCVGKTLVELDLRSLTGASVLAIYREGEGARVPGPREPLRAGDVLAVAGTHDALAAAEELLLGARTPVDG